MQYFNILLDSLIILALRIRGKMPSLEAELDMMRIISSCCRGYWTIVLDENQSSECIPFDRWGVSSLAARSNLSEKAKNQILHGSFMHDME